MDIRSTLEKGHSKSITSQIVNYVDSNQKRFNELITIFLEGPHRTTQRAAWPLSYAAINHPKLIEPHFSSILKMLDKKDAHDAVKRNIVRLLQFVDIPTKHQGKVVEKCFKLMDPKEPIAVRAFAMTVIANIAKTQPALRSELRIIIEDQLPYGSPGYQSRGKKILRQLEK